MYEISIDGESKIIEILELKRINVVAINYAKKFHWLKMNLEYIDFYKIIENKIKKLRGKGINQINCIHFFLEFEVIFGQYFEHDPYFIWLNQFYVSNSYLPELDLTNKLNDFIRNYKQKVIGEDYKFFLNALKKIIKNKDFSLFDIYPEKIKFLKEMNIEIPNLKKINLEEKLIFLFGYNYKENSFFYQYFEDSNSDMGQFLKDLERSCGY